MISVISGSVVISGFSVMISGFSGSVVISGCLGFIVMILDLVLRSDNNAKIISRGAKWRGLPAEEPAQPGAAGLARASGEDRGN